MLVENQNNEVEVLSVSEVKACNGIAKAVHGAWSSGLKRDEFINQGADRLVELVGTQPDFSFYKAVQAQTIQELINLGLAVDSANTYFGYIIKQSIAKHKFEKPSKDTPDGKRMSEKRQAIKDKYEHESLENITLKLKAVNERMAQAYLDNSTPSKEDRALASELKTAQDMKSAKRDSENKALQNDNIKKLRDEINEMLKVQTGFKKDGTPMMAWSICKLPICNASLATQCVLVSVTGNAYCLPTRKRG